MNTADNDHTSKLAWKILPWALDALIGVCLFIQVGMMRDIRALTSEVSGLQNWQAGVKASQWSAIDQANFVKEQTAELTKIWAKIADIEQARLREYGAIQSSISRIEAKVEGLKDSQ